MAAVAGIEVVVAAAEVLVAGIGAAVDTRAVVAVVGIDLRLDQHRAEELAVVARAVVGNMADLSVVQAALEVLADKTVVRLGRVEVHIVEVAGLVLVAQTAAAVALAQAELALGQLELPG